MLLKYKQIGGDITKQFILLDGTSSVGKTTLCNFFKTLKYTCLISDDYVSIVNDMMANYYKTISNNYFPKNKRYDIEDNIFSELIINDAIKAKKAIIDSVVQSNLIKKFTEFDLRNKLFIIVVYASLPNLVRNLQERRINGDRRALMPFYQFQERYIMTNDNDINKIDRINRQEFKQLLKENLKFEFESEDKLNIFVINMFNNMNINDDDFHWIKLKENYECDYLLNATDKTKDVINTELNKLFNNILN